MVQFSLITCTVITPWNTGPIKDPTILRTDVKYQEKIWLIHS